MGYPRSSWNNHLNPTEFWTGKDSYELNFGWILSLFFYKRQVLCEYLLKPEGEEDDWGTQCIHGQCPGKSFKLLKWSKTSSRASEIECES